MPRLPEGAVTFERDAQGYWVTLRMGFVEPIKLFLAGPFDEGVNKKLDLFVAFTAGLPAGGPGRIVNVTAGEPKRGDCNYCRWEARKEQLKAAGREIVEVIGHHGRTLKDDEGNEIAYSFGVPGACRCR